MVATTDLHLEVDFTNAGTFGGTYDDVTSLTLPNGIQTLTGRDNASSLTGRASAGRLRALLNNSDDRFSPFNASSVLTKKPTFVAAGTAGTGNGAVPTNHAMPAGVAVGHYMLTFLYTREATDAVVSISDGWREFYNSRDSGGLLAVWGRAYQTGDTIPTFTATGLAAGDDVIVQISAWADVNLARPLGTKGTISTNSSAQNIGAISGITLGANALLIVCGGKADDWTSVATLSQSGMTFAEVGEPDTTTGNDAGLVWDYATVDDGSQTTITSKTFSVTGGGSAVGKGVMFSLNPASLIRPGLLVRLRDDSDVLWIGKLDSIVPVVARKELHKATLEAIGIFAELANVSVLPINTGTGDDTGTLIAGALDDAGFDDSGIEAGDVTTGPFGQIARGNLLDLIRPLEDTEGGFLYEDQASYRVMFENRSHRQGVTSSAATFSDDPSDTLFYEAAGEEDWRGYIFNRCVAGVTPYTLADAATLVTLPGPYSMQPGGSQALIAEYTSNPLVSFTGHTRDIYYGSNVPVHQSITGGTSAGFDLTPTITYPATVTPDDLLLLLFISELTGTIVAAPSGWETALLNYSLPAGDVNFGVFFKKAVGNEDGTTFAGPTINAARRSSWQIYRDTSWNGKDVDVEITSSPSTGTSSAPDSPSITPSWGALKSMFLSVLVSTTDSTLWNASASPSGYTFGLKTVSPNGYGLNSAYRAESTGVTSENPGAFTMSSSKLWAAFTIAIRGLRSSSLNVVGATPNTQDGAFTISYDNSLGGGVGQQDHENVRVTGTYLVAGDESLVQADYYPSQAVVGVRSYKNPSNLFANISDAQAYANLIVNKLGEARPVLSMSYMANRDDTHYAQAIALKVGSRITLKANRSQPGAGLGISEDFFVESIARSITKTRHQVTYQLSPASVTDA